MKLTALGIDSRDFDSDRMEDLRGNLRLLYKWLLFTQDDSSGRKSLCEAASILDKLVTRDVPLTQYRGMTFKDLALADSLLGGKATIRYACESWTPNLRLAEKFALEYGPRRGIRYLMKRTFAKQEIVLDVEGLAEVMSFFSKELTKAGKLKEVHQSVRAKDLWQFLAKIDAYISHVYGLGEEEFLMHPRPYSAKDVFMLKIGMPVGDLVLSQIPVLASIVNADPRHSFETLVGREVEMRRGKIKSVSSISDVY